MNTPGDRPPGTSGTRINVLLAGLIAGFLGLALLLVANIW
jgi:hypothetical protein